MVELRIAIFLSLLAAAVYSEDGDQWLHCSKYGCSLAECDPMPDTWIVGGDQSSGRKESPSLCRRQKTIELDSAQVSDSRIIDQQGKISELVGKLDQLEKRVARTESEEEKMKRDISSLKKEKQDLQNELRLLKPARNPCQNHACHKNAQCIPTQDANGYTCKCFQGYVGSGFDCQLPCYVNDCHPNAVCRDEPNGKYSCYCMEGYTGNGKSCMTTTTVPPPTIPLRTTATWPLITTAPTTRAPTPDCRDLQKECSVFAASGFCADLQSICPLSCGLCDPGPPDGILVVGSTPMTTTTSFRPTTNQALPRGNDQRSCKDIDRRNGNEGLFRVYPDSYKSGVVVYCDLVSDGGGWTVFQRRFDGRVNFNRNWLEYVDGFGNTGGDYWMGLEQLYRLTSDGKYELRIDLENWKGQRTYAKYSTFAIAGASDKYRLRVSGYSGTAGNSFRTTSGTSTKNQDNQRFSTIDQDNDRVTRDCASIYKSGWWFNGCARANLNGRYFKESDLPTPQYQGVYWHDWEGDKYSLKFSEMKFRRKD